jgi:outer membrane immunogenic protein
MRNLFLATTAIVALIAIPAGAADLRTPVKAPPVYKPACAQFGGFYIGGHAGWNYYEHHYKDVDQLGGNLAVFGVDDVTNTDSAWHGGVQAGYNWQSGCTVFGVQADWSWTNAEADSFHQAFPVAGTNTEQLNSQLRWFGTARARTGIVVDNLLLYVTGGLAFARFERDYTFHNNGIPGSTVVFETNRNRLGFVVGVGTEWSFAPNWSFVSEFLYMGFEKDEQTLNCSVAAFCGGLTGAPFRFEFNDNVWATRIGVNYRFGGAPY